MNHRKIAALSVLAFAASILSGCAVDDRRVSTTQTTTTREVTTSPYQPPTVTETRTTRTY